MGAPESGMKAAEQGTADSLLTSFRTIKADERVRHAGVLDYWLSIRGNKEFPPLHDLDPLELSDAGPSSILLELISGGQDAEVRHLGDDLKGEIAVDRIIDAPNPSILTCIAKKLPIVAISREFLAFEDSYDTAEGWTRCWVTLLPLSSCGSWVDYVYAFVSFEKKGGKVSKPADAPTPVAEAPEETPVEAVVEEAEAVVESVEPEAVEGAVEPEAALDEPEAPEAVVEEEVAEEAVEPVEAVESAAEPEAIAESESEPEAVVEPEPEPEPEPVEAFAELEPEPGPEPEAEPEEAVQTFEDHEPEPAPRAGFSKLIEGFANLTGFYGQSVNIDPAVPIEPEAEEFAEEPQAVDEPAPEPQPADPEPVVLEEAAAEPVEIEQPVAEPAEEAAPEPAPEIAQEEAAPAPEPAPLLEGSLQSKLTEVRAKADEARQAALRATAALHEGLSATYDFALDAETSPEEYLRLVEAQGLKIQLRAPMAPVVKLAFDGLADPTTIKQLEAVLAWALKEELPRGALGERIQEAGGISELLDEIARPN